jgi:hypothetical protein
MLVEIYIRGSHPQIIDVDGGTTVAMLRRRLARDYGVSTSAALTFNGNALENDAVLVPDAPAPTTPAALLAQYAGAADPIGGVALMRVCVA